MNEGALNIPTSADDDALRMQEAVRKLDSIQTNANKKFLDIPVSMQVLIGGAKMPLRDILGLKPGSVVVLDRDMGEPVSICIGGKTIASAQIVVCDGERPKLGVSIIEMNEDTSGLAENL